MLKTSFRVCNHRGIHSTLINGHADQKLLVCQMQAKSIHLSDTCNYPGIISEVPWLNTQNENHHLVAKL